MTHKPSALPPPSQIAPSRWRRWRRRLAYAAIGLLVVWFALPAVDRVWFKLTVPAEFGNARWHGEWESDTYALVSGRLVAQLPDPLPVGEEFEAEVLVYYRIWSLYRTGRHTRIHVAGLLNDSNSGGGQGGGSVDETGIRLPPFRLTMKGSEGSSIQSIDYLATADEELTLIAGAYRARGPSDLGRFVLARR